MLGKEVVQIALHDWRAAPLSAPVRAMLGFLEKLTLTPEALTPADLATVLAAGVSEQAIEDAIAICMLFSIINRLADTLDFAVPSWEEAASGAAWSLANGYKRR